MTKRTRGIFALSILVALDLLFLLMFPGIAGAQEEDGVAGLEKRITELRWQARHREALELARELLALRRAEPEAKGWERADAERLVSTLEFVAGLSRDARRDLAAADSLGAVVDECWNKSQFAEARAAVERQLEIRRTLLGQEHPEVTESLGNLGALRLATGDFAGAEQLFTEALTMNRKILGAEHPEFATNLNNLAYVCYARGDYGCAESFLREALGIWRRILGDVHANVAIALDGLALLLQAQGNYAGAEPIHREVLVTRRELHGKEHPDVALSLNNLGLVLHHMGAYAEAELLYREALAMRRKLLGEEHIDVAQSLNNLGGLLDDRGDYAAAELLYRRALVIRRKLLGEDHPEVATSLNNLAVVLQIQGDYGEAEPFFREALARTRDLYGQEHPLVAACLNNLAGLISEQGNHVGAEALYREALAIRRRVLGEEHPDVAQSLNNIGAVLRERGDYTGAQSLYSEALAMYERLLGNEHPDVALCLNNLAHVLWDQRNYVVAEPFCREALSMRQGLLSRHHPDIATSLGHLARLLRAQGKRASAEPMLTEAALIFDAARLRAGTGVDRAAFSQHSPYTDLAAGRLALGKIDDAWPAAEKALARSLADLLVAAGERHLCPSEAAEEDSLQKRLSNLEGKLAAYREAARDDPTLEDTQRVEETRDQLFAAELKWGVFQREMAARYPVTEGETFPLDRVQASLGKRSALIGWVDVEMRKGEYDSWGYVVTSSGPVRWARLGSPSEEEGKGSPSTRVRAFRDVLANPSFLDSDAPGHARDLYAGRIEPLLGALEGVEHLIVIPSGAMVGIPIETLVDDGGVFLGDRYAVSYVPSATIYAWLTEKATETGGAGRALLVGDPPFSDVHVAAMEDEEEVVIASARPIRDVAMLRSALAGNGEALAALQRLPGTRSEVAGIAAVATGATVLLGPDASEQKLVHMAQSGELADFETIHFATHALVDDERPEQSALVLSQVNLPDPVAAAVAGTRVYDGVVTAKEIVREWDLDADLVTLSACETGLGREVAGEGYIGFAHAFLQAGARSLLVSLWPVEDEATSMLMRRFYENRAGTYEEDRGAGLGKPMSRTRALQEAKHWLRTYEDEYSRRPFEHPYFWSAFILIGDRG